MPVRGRRRLRAGVTGVAAALALATASASLPVFAGASGPPTPSPRVQAAAISGIVRRAMATGHLRAVIVEVTKNGRLVTRRAFGTSLTGEPATTAMHFRNGAVAFAYVSTLLMEYVDEHKVQLDDTINRWLPTLPESNQVTLKMLANQTSGYPDFETDPTWTAAFNADPFHIFTYQERIKYAFARPVQFAPGTNWSYSHTNFMILGRILSMIGRKPLAVLLQQKVLGPMGLTNTVSSQTSAIPSPVLHSYSSEREVALKIPSGVTFYEESTFWNSAWGTPDGANETTTIGDMAKTAVAVGTGKLLSKASYHAMVDSNLLGFGHAQPTCAGSCFTQVPIYNYGLGVVRSGGWILQNPLVSGYSATEAYLPSEKVAIAVVTTFEPGAFNAQGVEPNASDTIFRALGAYMAPQQAPPVKS
jgi:CubicO group peptidase (beta-lactamase class C family)